MPLVDWNTIGTLSVVVIRGTREGALYYAMDFAPWDNAYIEYVILNLLSQLPVFTLLQAITNASSAASPWSTRDKVVPSPPG